MSDTNILQLPIAGALNGSEDTAPTVGKKPSGPETEAPSLPNVRKQVTADMSSSNGVVLASVTGITPAATTVSVTDFGAKGDGIADDTKAIQAAIDSALQNGISTVYVPEGRYKTSDTLHLGWGNSFYEVNLVGQQAASYGGNQTGAKILPTAVDRPCINIQGGRNSGIYGIGFRCDALFQYMYSNIGGAGQDFPSDPTRWNDNVHIPDGLQRYHPFCCISIDAYSGSTQYYPTVTYPDWTKLSSQTGLAHSSRCTIDSCDISGFCVGIITEPCGGDGNGDFTRIRNCSFTYSVYGIAICHTQSRSVEIRNCVWGGVHTFVDNSTFGMGAGQLDGGMDLCSGGGSYQAFNIGVSSWCGNFVVKNLYMESSVRIGLFSAGFATFLPGVLFEGCHFSFGASADAGIPHIVPAAYLEVDGPSPVKFSHCGFSSNRFFIVNAGSKTVFENCQWQTGREYVTRSLGAVPDAAIAAGYSRFGGMQVPNRENNDGPQIIGRCEGTYFNRSTLQPGSQYFQSACSHNTADSVVHAAAESYRDLQGRNWPILSRPPARPFGLASGGPFTVQPTQSGMTLSGEINATQQVNRGITDCLDPGDILEDQSTGNIYIITSVTLNTGTNNYAFTAVQQNNYSVRTGAAVPLATVSSGPYIWLYKSIFRLPTDMYFGDFVAGSVNVTNIHRGDGYGGDIQTNIPAGMVIAEDVFYAWTGNYVSASKGNTRVVSTTNGSPGSLTLNRAAGSTGRFPIMPVLLTGVNVMPPCQQRESVGSFTCAAAASTTVKDLNVTAQSRILLTPTNAAAAALLGSAKAIYISAKSVGTSFTVTTANAGSAGGTETFDYLIDG